MKICNMKQLRYIFSVFIFITIILLSCSKTDSTPNPTPTSGGGGNTCATATEGTLFKEVKNLLANNCVTCHNPTGQMPSVDFRDNCVIQTKASLIKQRAVDQGTMPPTGPLSQTDKDKITAWVTAGGRVTD
jgi:uncharacterized membrane protein